VPVDITDECAFCAIARGEDNDVEVVASASDWVAFFPLSPATSGHTLVIPRTHVADFWHADPRLACSLAAAAVQVGQAIEAALKPEGMNLITSAGQAAEQTVFHLHLHVVPRWRSDDIDAIWPPKRIRPATGNSALAQKIRRAVAKLRDGHATA
jgi:histidine triad (HIT) family protein